MQEILVGIGAVLAGVGSLASWRNTKRTQTIVQGNGHGTLDKMAEATLFQLADIRHLLVNHITDGSKHAAILAADLTIHDAVHLASHEEVLSGQRDMLTAIEDSRPTPHA